MDEVTGGHHPGSEPHTQINVEPVEESPRYLYQLERWKISPTDQEGNPHIIKFRMLVKVPTDCGMAQDSTVGNATIEAVPRSARMETAPPQDPCPVWLKLPQELPHQRVISAHCQLKILQVEGFIMGVQLAERFSQGAFARMDGEAIAHTTQAAAEA